jgi:hypothetical protein
MFLELVDWESELDRTFCSPVRGCHSARLPASSKEAARG